jgi:hypothetical protein
MFKSNPNIVVLGAGKPGRLLALLDLDEVVFMMILVPYEKKFSLSLSLSLISLLVMQEKKVAVCNQDKTLNVKTGLTPHLLLPSIQNCKK